MNDSIINIVRTSPNNFVVVFDPPVQGIGPTELKNVRDKISKALGCDCTNQCHCDLQYGDE